MENSCDLYVESTVLLRAVKTFFRKKYWQKAQLTSLCKAWSLKCNFSLNFLLPY